MAKNKPLKKFNEELDEDFDFFEDMEAEDEDMVSDVMAGLMEINRHHMMMAIELTKLIVDKCSTGSVSEEKVFSVFNRATKVISENSPLKNLIENAAA